MEKDSTDEKHSADPAEKSLKTTHDGIASINSSEDSNKLTLDEEISVSLLENSLKNTHDGIGSVDTFEDLNKMTLDGETSVDLSENLPKNTDDGIGSINTFEDANKMTFDGKILNDLSENSPKNTHDGIGFVTAFEDANKMTLDEENLVILSENSPKSTHDGICSIDTLEDSNKRPSDGEILVNLSEKSPTRDGVVLINTLEDTSKLTLDAENSTNLSENSPKDTHDEIGSINTVQDVNKLTLDGESSINVSGIWPKNTPEENKIIGLSSEMKSRDVSVDNFSPHHEKEIEGSVEPVSVARSLKFENPKEVTQSTEGLLAEEKVEEPVFDGTETLEQEPTRSLPSHSLDPDSEMQTSVWPEKAAAIRNFVKERGAVAVSSVIRRLSGKKDEDEQTPISEEEKNDNSVKDDGLEADSNADSKLKEVPQSRSTWNPLSFIKIGREVDIDNKPEQVKLDNEAEETTLKGRIIVYTRLACQDCKEVRLFMRQKRLRFVEINIDIYPSRKLELERNTGSSAVPKVYLNDFLVGGLNELKAMDDSGELLQKINELFNEETPSSGPLPPLPGEDDESDSGKVDEMASIVRKMKESIILKDRFYKMRRFNNCFLGSEAVDFLAEDQYLEREEAVEFGRKLVRNHFFWHVLEENIFEDGNHLYRFLEHDPAVLTQCYNIPSGAIDIKPKPVTEIASRLRFLSFAILEAYVSEDGRHVDYRNIHGSEEFKRYLRIAEELQRVELGDLSREEKLAFFINLYNMMAIHAILVWGYPAGALDRKKFFGDFKYVVGGCTYSLSAIQNGILRGNQRPPYNLTKPFGPKDKRFKVALRYPEPLVHFALVFGSKSGPALRCYSPGNIDKELMEAARDFLRNGGLTIDAEAKVASASKILRWFSVDFGKNEAEVLKHAANYLEPEKLEKLLELLASTQLKVTYQPYDWGLNSYK